MKERHSAHSNFRENLRKLKRNLLGPNDELKEAKLHELWDENDAVSFIKVDATDEERVLLAEVTSSLIQLCSFREETNKILLELWKCVHLFDDFQLKKICFEKLFCKVGLDFENTLTMINYIDVRGEAISIVDVKQKDVQTGAKLVQFYLDLLKTYSLYGVVEDVRIYRGAARILRVVLSSADNDPTVFIHVLSNFFGTLTASYGSTSPGVYNDLVLESVAILQFVLEHEKIDSKVVQNVVRIIAHLCPAAFVHYDFCNKFVAFLISNIGALALDLFTYLFRKLGHQAHLLQSTALDVYRSYLDVLRALPSDVEVARLRLLAWWQFLCVLPSQVLSDAFRLLMVPFLANTLGRYISPTHSLGDNRLHRYQLSFATVYNGDSTAHAIMAHMFSCLFDFPAVEPEGFLGATQLPNLQVSSQCLAEHGFDLLMTVAHWLRYVCGPNRLRVNGRVGQMWLACLESIRNAVTANKASERDLFLRHCVELSLLLLSPRKRTLPPADSKPIIKPPEIDIESNPSPADCSEILHEVVDILETEKEAVGTCSVLLSMVCGMAFQLVACWHREHMPMNERMYDLIQDIAVLGTDSMEKDGRLRPDSSGSPGYLLIMGEHLANLVPECVDFVVRALRSKPNARLLVDLYTRLPNEAGLKAWLVLSDRLINLVVNFNVICDAASSSGTFKGLGRADLPSELTSFVAFFLAPIFMAGSSANPPPPELEDNVIAGLEKLGSVMHNRANSLPNHPVNSWIGCIGDLVHSLVRSQGTSVKERLNLRVVAHFVSYMAKAAYMDKEGELTGATKNRPLGTMTSVVKVVGRCLAVMPLDRPKLQSAPSSAHASPGQLESRSRVSLGDGDGDSGLDRSLFSPRRFFRFVDRDLRKVLSYSAKQSAQRVMVQALWDILNKYVFSGVAFFVLMERVSGGLLNLVKLLNSESLLDDTVAAVVSTLEAFVTFAWLTLSKMCGRPLQNKEGGEEEQPKPLKLTPSEVLKLREFCEAAIRLARVSVATIPHRLATAVAADADRPVGSGRNPATEMVVSHRHGVFVTCLLSMWDTLIEAGNRSADFQPTVIELTGQLASALVKLPRHPRPTLRGRKNFPQWVPEDVLPGKEEEEEEDEEEMPLSALSQLLIKRHGGATSTRKRNRESSSLDASDTDAMSRRKKDGPRSAKRRRSSQSSATSRRRLSLANLSPDASANDADTRRASQAFSLTALLTPGPSTISSRRRESHAISGSASDLSASIVADDLAAAAPASSGVLGAHQGIGGGVDAVSSRPTPPPSTRGRRKRNSAISPPPLPNAIEFDDSANFVFIPPTGDPLTKRMRLTEHQRERRREQRQEYVPTMYNSLDRSNSNMSESQSQDSSSLPVAALASNHPEPVQSETTPLHVSEQDAAMLTAMEAEPMETYLESGFEVDAVEQLANKRSSPEVAPAAGEEEGPLAAGVASIPETEVSQSAEELTLSDTSQKTVAPESSSDSHFAKPGPLTASAPLSRLLEKMARPVAREEVPSLNRSPLIAQSPLSSRSVKILTMGLQQAAKRKLESLTAASATPRQQPTPVRGSTLASPSPSRSSGILRDVNSPSRNCRVSFADPPAEVFLIEGEKSETKPISIAKSGESMNQTDLSTSTTALVAGDVENAEGSSSPSVVSSRRRKSYSPRRHIAPVRGPLQHLSSNGAGSATAAPTVHRWHSKPARMSPGADKLLEEPRQKKAGETAPDVDAVVGSQEPDTNLAPEDDELPSNTADMVVEQRGDVVVGEKDAKSPPGVETSTVEDAVEAARETLGVLRARLTSLPVDYQKELLFEVLGLFKSLMP